MDGPLDLGGTNFRVIVMELTEESEFIMDNKVYAIPQDIMIGKVHIFWEGQNFLQNLHRRFVLWSASQIYNGDFAKMCGLLRIYEH